MIIVLVILTAALGASWSFFTAVSGTIEAVGRVHEHDDRQFFSQDEPTPSFEVNWLRYNTWRGRAELFAPLVLLLASVVVYLVAAVYFEHGWGVGVWLAVVLVLEPGVLRRTSPWMRAGSPQQLRRLVENLERIARQQARIPRRGLSAEFILSRAKVIRSLPEQKVQEKGWKVAGTNVLFLLLVDWPSAMLREVIWLAKQRRDR